MTFTPCFDWVIQRTGSLVTASVYGAIWRYCQMREQACFASQHRLAEELRLSRRSVGRHIKALLELGLIRDQTPGVAGTPHRYKVMGDGGGARPEAGVSGVPEEDACDSASQPCGLPSQPTSGPVSHPCDALSHPCDTESQPPATESRSNRQSKRQDRIPSREGLPVAAAAAEGAAAPSPRGKGSKPVISPELKAAAEALRSVTGRYPPKAAWTQLAQRLGGQPDLELLRRCYSAWCLRGYNPTNLSGLLDWYRQGGPPDEGNTPGSPHRRSSRAPGKEAHNVRPLDHSQVDRWSQWEDRVRAGESADAVRRELGL